MPPTPACWHAGAPRTGTSPLSERVRDVEGFLKAHARGVPVALGTSGTSGRSRAVVRTTESWVRSFGHVSALTGLGADSRVWVPGPLTATMNLFAAVHAHVAGAALVDGPRDLTHAQLTPTALRRCLDDGVPLAGVTVVVAGDRLSPTLADLAVSAGAQVCHYYGAAELSFVAWGRDAEELAPFPEAVVEVRDGEVWVRSPYLCTGYDGSPGPLRRDADGFATVGDRAAWHEGRLRVSGRPDAVTTGGATVLVSEVEDQLRPAARGAVVVLGVPHAGLGAVVAVVLTEATDHAAVRQRAAALPPSQRPRLWYHVASPPLTEAGKTDRVALLDVVSAPDVPRLV